MCSGCRKLLLEARLSSHHLVVVVDLLNRRRSVFLIYSRGCFVIQFVLLLGTSSCSHSRFRPTNTISIMILFIAIKVAFAAKLDHSLVGCLADHYWITLLLMLMVVVGDQIMVLSNSHEVSMILLQFLFLDTSIQITLNIWVLDLNANLLTKIILFRVNAAFLSLIDVVAGSSVLIYGYVTIIFWFLEFTTVLSEVFYAVLDTFRAVQVHELFVRVFIEELFVLVRIVESIIQLFARIQKRICVVIVGIVTFLIMVIILASRTFNRCFSALVKNLVLLCLGTPFAIFES